VVLLPKQLILFVKRNRIQSNGVLQLVMYRENRSGYYNIINSSTERSHEFNYAYLTTGDPTTNCRNQAGLKS
jgi:hypothetical protein